MEGKFIALVTNLDDLNSEDSNHHEDDNRFKHLSALPIEVLAHLVSPKARCLNPWTTMRILAPSSLLAPTIPKNPAQRASIVIMWNPRNLNGFCSLTFVTRVR